MCITNRNGLFQLQVLIQLKVYVSLRYTKNSHIQAIFPDKTILLILIILINTAVFTKESFNTVDQGFDLFPLHFCLYCSCFIEKIMV